MRTRRPIGRPVLRWLPIFLAVWALGAAGACVSSANAGERSVAARKGSLQRGKATWYGGKFHGRRTASGERFDKNSMTAAHRTLPFGTVVRVTNLRNKRSVRVRINNRGPYGGKGRVIDVSEAAARKLGMIRAGVVPVTIEVLRVPKKKRKRRHRR